MLEGQRKKNAILHIPNVRKMHPYQTMLYFAMVGSGFMFLVMMVMYTVQRYMDSNRVLDISLPKPFVISTIILMISSFMMIKARQYFMRDMPKRSVIFLSLALVLGIAFAVLQVFGWIEFYQVGFEISSHNVASSYVYVISGIHLVHVVLALSLLLSVLVPCYRKTRNIVDELILTTNPFEKKKVEMLAVFWHYIDIMWIFLFFYFVITF